MGGDFYASNAYEESLDIELKKTNGVYYTPRIIVDYIVKNTIKNHDILKNPYPKILDISCGCGNFLIEAYDVLYDLFEENIYELKEKYDSDYWKTDNLHNHIISNCIYGADIDEEAIKILKEELTNKDRDLKVDRFNLYCCDSLKQNWKNRFDYIIGNPPYVGHKNIEKEYKKFILKEYSEVYKGKADLYFCFYKKIIDLLKKDGVGSIITPRYFLESPSGKYIRKYISNNVNIEEIVDFLGASIFKNIGISSCITTFRKQKQTNSIKVLRIKDETINIRNLDSIEEFMKQDTFDHLILQTNSLEEWIILNTEDKSFYHNIEEKCDYFLEDICTSFQGIITGCDKAFVIHKENSRLETVDKNLLKPWVKNKNIDKYIVKENDYKLIYSDDIKNEESHARVIEEFIFKYKDKLLNRRECKKNVRKWYELQWGREKELFERVKIMYPYKAKQNKFAIDYNHSFCSADVYSFFIKKEYEKEFSYEYLLGILNSNTYDKYFKINAKKMSKKIYDYYPNKVMKLKIFKDENYKTIEDKAKEILHCINEKEYEKVDSLEKEIDFLIKKSLEL
ncbi:Eco57I restriction-modification methylase domain-containing protein [Romboutsia sp.]|uniref:Eco57I restriction-modification methylase domain-containing protein n=1 Tax=Romboutsia sp. TaxID=1965302 RepID=UPI003F32902C